MYTYMNDIKNIEIFKYTDYRSYLKDWYAAAKAEGIMSFRIFSRLSNLKSPNILKLVMDGDRNLSQTTALRFATALGLNKAEKDYFLNLVNLSQSKSTN